MTAEKAPKPNRKQRRAFASILGRAKRKRLRGPARIPTDQERATAAAEARREEAEADARHAAWVAANGPAVAPEKAEG